MSTTTAEEQKLPYDNIIIFNFGVAVYSCNEGYLAHNPTGPSWISPDLSEDAKSHLGLSSDEQKLIWTNIDGSAHRTCGPAMINYLGVPNYFINGEAFETLEEYLNRLTPEEGAIALTCAEVINHKKQ